MTIREAAERATALGPVAAIDPWGFCVLYHDGASFLGRGGTWEEAFDNMQKWLDSQKPLQEAPIRATVPQVGPPSLFDGLE